MIVGRFGNTTGRPYIEGHIVLPRFKGNFNAGAPVGNGLASFLVDTGADSTTITPVDGLRLSIPYGQLTNVSSPQGIGGAARAFAEPALLMFFDASGFLQVYQTTIQIIEPLNVGVYAVPSLLGRDIMRHWSLTCYQDGNLLTAEVKRALYSLPAPPSSTGLSPVPRVAPPPTLPLKPPS